ncbi:MAG: family 43 glycosylhydrolase [Chloroflexi bacterium]|nr:family 43 glycosylhydrolase [Chloroflexota bacterium]MCC6897227.1 family 43 glycosylhydrolase [Anaerolineae bacterium]
MLKQFLRSTLPFMGKVAAFTVLSVFLCISVVTAQSPENTFHNPLNTTGGDDPWLTYYEGYYYLANTTWTNQMFMRKSATLAGLKVAKPQLIYTETEPDRCCNMWAPEFYLLEGDDGQQHWYFYYTAGTQGTFDNQRSYVIESEGTDPMGPYTYKGRLFDPANDVWSIDGSVLQMDGGLYFLFSAWVGNLQSIFIAPMSNPWTISGRRAVISKPTLAWEQDGTPVNEGPVALHHDGKTFIVYSASFCGTPDYKLGLLTYNGGDVLSEESWVKNPEPVFVRSDENSVFGPGHNGFFKSPDGTEDWIVYHANSGEGDVCLPTRTTRVQKFTWNADGTPNFGTPVATTMELPNPSGDNGVDPLPLFVREPAVRLQSVENPDKYINHFTGRGRLGILGEPARDFQFAIVESLADPEAVFIQSYGNPGFYLINRNGLVWLAMYEDSDDFRASASFWRRTGLASDEGISFEAYSAPGSYILSENGFLNVKPVTTDAQKAAATFIVEAVTN